MMNKIDYKEIFSKPSCLCLHEMENNLPSTINCFVPCNGQYEILSRRDAVKWWDGLEDSMKEVLVENKSFTISTIKEEEIVELHIKEKRKI